MIFGKIKQTGKAPYNWGETNPQPSQYQQFQQFQPAVNSTPVSKPSFTKSTFMEDLRKVISRNMRIKPSYADCWLLGSVNDLDVIEEYETPYGHVTIGTALDGEIEYNLTPAEYGCSEVVNAVISDIIEDIRNDYRKNGGRNDRFYVNGLCRTFLSGYTERLLMGCNGNSGAMEELMNRICDIVYRYTVGLGVFDVLLSDPRLEDIYIDAPCDKNRIHVTLSGIKGSNAHHRCRTNLVVEKKEVMNLISALKRESGLPLSHNSPVLETDMKNQGARATVVGYPLSPNGEAVAIRKHSSNPWTLTRLIANGTLDAPTAGFLSFLVQNRATFLICGARGAGKSSLLSAMMFEYPKSQRILTIEDTIELPSEKMRNLGYKVQSMLVDDHMGGTNLSKSTEALRVSLRMGESAIVLGEVRGEEAKILYESMRTGRAGSSIMGTIHGDSAKTVYDRVVHDMGISSEAFAATEILVTMGTVRDRKTGSQIRKVNELVATGDRIGEFIDMNDEIDFNTPVMRRSISTSGMTVDEIKEEIYARGAIRQLLADKSATDERYAGADWINIANEYVMRNAGKSADVLVNGFKQKLDLIN